MRILTIFLLAFPLLTFAQRTYSGKVMDAQTGKPIAYATVALKKLNTGVNAGELGTFSFTFAGAGEDTLIVSSVGYRSLYLPMQQWKDDTTLLLSRNEKSLKPVVVKNQWAYQELGGFKVKRDHFFTSLGNQYQVARRLQAPAAETWLDKIIIGVGKRGGLAMFRLRVYDLDPVTGGPGMELTDSAITVVSKGKVETVDVSPYMIYLPDREFFVAVEWILAPENKYMLKANVRGSGEMEREYYKPFISLTEERVSGATEIWGYFYSGNWKTVFPANREESLAIAARVRY